MEGLVEFIVMAIIQIFVVVFDPITRIIKAVSKAVMNFYNYLNPSSLPDVLTFDDLETSDDTL